MKLLAFGIAREIFGGMAADIAVPPGTTVAMLKAMLAEIYPAMQQLSSFMIAVNREYAPANQVIRDGDEVAIIPPVSGG